MTFNGIVESARHYALSVFKKDKKLLKHTEDVVNLCKKFGRGLDFEVLMVSAYLHDIGQTRDKNNHHKAGAEMVEIWLKKHGADKDFTQEVIHCISEHGKKGKPKSEEALFLKQVDGVSFFKWSTTVSLFTNIVFRKRQSRKEVSRQLSLVLKKITDKKLLDEAERRYKKVKFFAPGICFKDVRMKSTVLKIAKTLKESKIKYVLIGGAGLRIRGVNVNSRSIDILTNKKGALKFQELFESEVNTPVRFVKTNNYRTWFGKFDINKFSVEVMGNLEKKVKGEWTTPKLPKTSPIKLEGVHLNVMNLSEEIEIYEKLGLDIDPKKIKKIREFIQPVKL